MGNFLETDAGKKFMKFANSWGATVVIVGAMFKILHLPGGTVVIGFGLSVEAFLFFIAAFEPDPEHIDWSLVYPELKSGMHHSGDEVIEDLYEEDVEQKEVTTGDGTVSSDQIPIQSHHPASPEPVISPGVLRDDVARGKTSVNHSDATPASDESLGRVLASANIDQDLIKDLGEGLFNLKHTTEALSQISNIKVDEERYSEQLNVAANSLESLNAFYETQIEHSQIQAEVSKSLLENLSNTIEDSTKLHDQVRNLSDNMLMLNQVYGGMLSAMNVNK